MSYKGGDKQKRRQHTGRKNHNRDKYSDEGGHHRQDNASESSEFSDARSIKVKVYEDTVECFKYAPIDYSIPKPLFYTLEKLGEDKRDLVSILKAGEKMQVFIENIDTLNLAKRLLDEGNTTSQHLMILNMASKYKPGGGVRSGQAAQEEELFRRSNLFQHLVQEYYELDNSDLILNRDVIVIKDSNYKLIPRSYKLCSLAVAALKNPPLKRDGTYQDPNHYTLMYNKIHAIFKIAYLNKMDTLVLGAIGSGCYHNPVDIIAKIFREMVVKFDGCFKTVSFAVLCGRDTTNFDTFKEEVEHGFIADTRY